MENNIETSNSENSIEISNKKTIILENIYKSFDEKNVLENISLKINSDNPMCIVAPSGTGKSTLLNIIAGIDSPTSGKIITNTKKISFQFQESRLFPHLTLMENLILSLKMNRNQIIEKSCNLLSEKEFDTRTCESSGGMKRRCEIIRALLFKSDMVILDEPFSFLDEECRKKSIEFILKNVSNRILVVATHDIRDINDLGADVYKI